MPWKRMDVDEQRMQFVIRAISGRERMSALCREFGISRPTGYLWRQRYRQASSLTEVSERSRRPHRSPRRTAAGTEQRVVALRQQTGWGAKKLRVLLHEEEELPLAVRTIHRILERHDLVSEDAHGPAPGRFERSEPNELWQMDSKGKYPLSDAKAYPCLVETFRCYGVPQAMLMDRGSLWWSAWNGWGLTRLSVRLIEQGIRLLYGRVRHPQTQGKVERFHRTLGEALRHRGVPQWFREWPAALAEFRSSYNERRPHEALGMKRPTERYQRSRRNYEECVKQWEYPEGSEVRCLNSQGMLSEQRRRWFVCESLAGQRVRVERFDGKLLVSYRHMYIREIDLERGASQALVVSREAAENAPVALLAPSAFSAAEIPTQGDV